MTAKPAAKPAPRATFCACPDERFVAGTSCYVKAKGVLTTVLKEAAPDCKTVVGIIDAQGRLKLSKEAEEALAA